MKIKMNDTALDVHQSGLILYAQQFFANKTVVVRCRFEIFCLFCSSNQDLSYIKLETKMLYIIKSEWLKFPIHFQSVKVELYI